jgi:hypothetical protein
MFIRIEDTVINLNNIIYIESFSYENERDGKVYRVIFNMTEGHSFYSKNFTTKEEVEKFLEALSCDLGVCATY